MRLIQLLVRIEPENPIRTGDFLHTFFCIENGLPELRFTQTSSHPAFGINTVSDHNTGPIQ